MTDEEAFQVLGNFWVLRTGIIRKSNDGFTNWSTALPSIFQVLFKYNLIFLFHMLYIIYTYIYVYALYIHVYNAHFMCFNALVSGNSSAYGIDTFSMFSDDSSLLLY